MTAIQLNAELYRAMGEIADNETLLAKVLAYVKSLAPAKTAKAESGWADRFAGASLLPHFPAANRDFSPFRVE